MLHDLVRDCRMSVCEALYLSGPAGALAALAGASATLAPFVASGDLTTRAAWDPLQEVSKNLGLVRLYGQDVVQAAIASGPRIYATPQLRAA